MSSKSLLRPLEAPEICTLCLIQQDERLLLGQKKRGFGVGYWNGFGGHVEPDETIERAAIRELSEESGLIATKLKKQGLLEFTFADASPDFAVHVFGVEQFTGDPIETEEMIPRWFSLDTIPYAKMWADDVHWLPLALANKHFHGRFHFHDTHTLVEHDVKELIAAP